MVKPIVVELHGRRRRRARQTGAPEVGQLEGRAALRFTRRQRRHTRPGPRELDRQAPTRAPSVNIVAKHDRSGQVSVTCPLG